MSNVLNTPWKVVKAHTYDKYDPEDLSIYTVDDEEVIGCSEWMRAEESTFEYIVQLHNERLFK